MTYRRTRSRSLYRGTRPYPRVRVYHCTRIYVHTYIYYTYSYYLVACTRTYTRIWRRFLIGGGSISQVNVGDLRVFYAPDQATLTELSVDGDMKRAIRAALVHFESVRGCLVDQVSHHVTALSPFHLPLSTPLHSSPHSR